jgi:flagellar biosynthesis protein FlhF
MAEALSQVKRDLGKDAVILQTRTFRLGAWFGFGGKPTVEITATVGVEVPSRGAGARARSVNVPAPTAEPAEVPAGGIAAALERAYGRPGRGTHAAVTSIDTAAASTTLPPVAPPPLSAAHPGRASAAVAQENARAAAAVAEGRLSPDLREELGAIRTMLGQVLQASARQAASNPANPGSAGVCAPPMGDALLKHYLRLLQADVAREIADAVVGRLRDELTPAELADESIVRQSVLRQLEGLIRTDAALAPPVRQPDGRPQVMALVGPTGVGKTTTIAKLAAAYRLRHGRKVGLVTADTYRIAAVDQLRTYANIIGVPLKVALTPEEMAEACDAFSEMDAVLIDTAGRSPGDDQRLGELAAMLHAARPHQTHLVLSSVAGEGALLRTIERFEALNPTRVIFTKLDEAASFGMLVNVAAKVQSTLSYVTLGQEVPDDIEPGRPDRLARLILDGALQP